MQHVRGFQADLIAFRGGVGIGQIAFAVPVNLHAIRQEWVQTEDVGLAAADDLAVAVTPQQ